MDASVVFRPFRSPKLDLPNRLVMAPMTRALSPGGVPGADVAEYYARRAAAGIGLIITEGTWIDHPSASNEEAVPRFYGEDAIAGWRRVVAAVHEAGGKIAPQLWHVGLTQKHDLENLYEAATDVSTVKLTPSGYIGVDEKISDGSTEREIEDAIEAYGKGARQAMAAGFDAVELHGAHGYAIDQFFWDVTNRRSDGWGGRTLAERARFGIEAVRACRAATGPDFPIIFRFSQWKQQDYAARLASTPQELASLLEPLADAGVDIFHASQRRFWEPEFDGSDINLAGWAQKLTGKPAIAVGSVGLSSEMLESLLEGKGGDVTDVDELLRRMERDEFDLIAIGRALLADPQWPLKLREGRLAEAAPYTKEVLLALN